MSENVCNVCGKRFDEWDENCNFSIDTTVGYGSIFDGDRIRIQFCTECFDALVNNCTVSPIVEDF